MAVIISPTPNPNALKFTVGAQVGGPKTFVAGQEIDDPMAAAILELAGSASIFMTADFVTVTKEPDSSWDDLTPPIQTILETHFSN